MKWAIAIWLVVMVATVGASGYFDGCYASSDAEKVEAARAPEFDLIRLNGLPVRLREHQGKTIILDFWATWCAPCEVQMPILNELWNRRGGPDLLVLGVSMDTRPADEVVAWLKERELGYPIAISDQQLALDYGAWAFPTLVVVDPHGNIYKTHQGVLSRPQLDDLLDQIAREFPSLPRG